MKSMPALFLDRDGVINKEKNYLFKIIDFEFISGVFEVCRYYQSQNYKIIVVTNQAGLARGYYSIDDFTTLNDWMLKKFHQQEVEISKVYYCPHHPEGSIPHLSIKCACRKPEPGMLLQAKEDFNINMKKSIMVGDKVGDVLAGKSAGIGKNFLVETGHYINQNARNIADDVLSNLSLLIPHIR